MEHKKNDGQSDKRQKNQCQNALPQGDPFCAEEGKKEEVIQKKAKNNRKYRNYKPKSPKMTKAA